MTEKNKKSQNSKVGARGEKEAAKYLRKKGYKIVARNVHLTHGEIDIIARNSQYIVFVEVKTRADNDFLKRYGRPAKAVDAEKNRHLVSAANEYLKNNKVTLLPRGDIVEVYVSEKGKLFKRKAYRFEHLTNTFGYINYHKHNKKHR